MLQPSLKMNLFSLDFYRPEDEDRFVEMAMDPISVQFMDGTNGIETEERELFKKIFLVYKEPNKGRWFWVWGIYVQDILCGHLELKESEHTLPNELEIVYMIHPDYRQKGLMGKVLKFLKSQQSQWNKRIIATVLPDNLHSISLLEKWGIDATEVLTQPESKKSYLKILLSR